MKNSTKITLIILTTVSVILLLIYFFLDAIGKSTPQEVVYPASNLSQSIFDSQRQNMVYTPNGSLTEVYAFSHCPYQFDTVKAESAHVGDNGVVYDVVEGSLLFTTEFPATESVSNVIKNELTNAILIDADVANSALENNVYEEGYINGFKAAFRVDTLTVSNGNTVQSAYLTGYELTITEEDANHGYNIYLGVVSNADTTEQYNTSSVILGNVLHTFQYNEDLQNALVQAEDKLAREESLAAQRERDEQEANQTGEYVGVEGASDSIIQAGEDIPRKSTKTVAIEKEYRDVVITYSYSNLESEVSAVLYNPDHSQRYEPTSSGEGFMKFSISHMEPGTWTIEIDGDVGTDNMKLAIPTAEETTSDAESTDGIVSDESGLSEE